MTAKLHPSPPNKQLFLTKSHLILASGSPRRKEFFEELGVEFDVHSADVDEAVFDHEKPESFVRRLSLNKAIVVSKKYLDAWVVGADTVVVFGSTILGKPADSSQAFEMLTMLNGRWHEVWTGYAICNASQSVQVQGAIKTEVLFCKNSVELLHAYVRSGEPLDKAGAYGIQGQGGLLIEAIKGSYSNVVGLPLSEVVGSLTDLGVLRPI